MPPVAILVVAALCAAAAWALTPWARRIAEEPSRWLHRAVPTVVAGVAGAGAAWATDHLAVLVGLAALAVASGLLVAIDLAVHRLPDAIVWPTTGILLVALVVAAAASAEWGRLGTALLAMLAVGALYFVLGWISPTSLGLGDVKLSLPLGLALGWMGWAAAFVGVLAGFVLLLVVSLVALALRRTSLSGELPFGPWMLGGAAVGIAWAALAGA